MLAPPTNTRTVIRTFFQDADAKQVEVPEGTITKLTFCIKSNSKVQSASQTMPYESAYTSITPAPSPLPSPKSRSIDYSRQSSNVMESPDTSRSRMVSSQKVDRIEEVSISEPPIVLPGSRKPTIESSRRSTAEPGARRSHAESTARKSAAESTGSRRSGGGAGSRKSTMDNSEKMPRESDCTTRKCAVDPALRKGGESGGRKSSVETSTDSASRKGTMDTLKILEEQSEQSFDFQSIQDRKSDPELSVVSKPMEVSTSQSDIEMREAQTSPPETSKRSKISSTSVDDKKENSLTEQSDSANEQRRDSSQKTSEELLEEADQRINYNPVVQTVHVEQLPEEQWIGEFKTPGEESDIYGKSSAEETEAFRKSFGITKDTTSQTIESILSPSKPKKGHLFHKKNKIDPMQIVTSEDSETKESSDQQTRDSRSGQEEAVAERKGGDVCPACNKPQLPPGQGAFQYYHIYRDKRGQIYCETCASPNTVKVVHKLLNSQKRLKCMGCGNFIQYKSVQTRPSSTPSESGDACSTCGRP